MMMMKVLGDDRDKSNKNICPITNDHGDLMLLIMIMMFWR
jgi:hypothetical protein